MSQNCKATFKPRCRVSRYALLLPRSIETMASVHSFIAALALRVPLHLLIRLASKLFELDQRRGVVGAGMVVVELCDAWRDVPEIEPQLTVPSTATIASRIDGFGSYSSNGLQVNSSTEHAMNTRQLIVAAHWQCLSPPLLPLSDDLDLEHQLSLQIPSNFVRSKTPNADGLRPVTATWFQVIFKADSYTSSQVRNSLALDIGDLLPNILQLLSDRTRAELCNTDNNLAKVDILFKAIESRPRDIELLSSFCRQLARFVGMKYMLRLDPDRADFEELIANELNSPRAASHAEHSESDSAPETVLLRDIAFTEELGSGTTFFVYSAKHKGRRVTVKSSMRRRTLARQVGV
ncbi:hypothetical protein C8F01DRAFT_1259688 [Mycena amicta]|nr:hypothetical protein C8F01DRAFT_1259688 [Mycena amicta]